MVSKQCRKHLTERLLFSLLNKSIYQIWKKESVYGLTGSSWLLKLSEAGIYWELQRCGAVREEEQFYEKGKLKVVHCLSLLLSCISGKLQIQGTVVSVLKEILIPKGFLCQELLLTFLLSYHLYWSIFAFHKGLECIGQHESRAVSFILETEVFTWSFLLLLVM